MRSSRHMAVGCHCQCKIVLLDTLDQGYGSMMSVADPVNGVSAGQEQTEDHGDNLQPGIQCPHV